MVEDGAEEEAPVAEGREGAEDAGMGKTTVSGWMAMAEEVEEEDSAGRATRRESFKK